MWTAFQPIELQTDPLAFIVGLGSLLVSSYIAIVLSKLSRKFSQNEATRSINEGWDAFHTAMLNKETHELFWSFMRSPEPFVAIGERNHHIVLMYLNNVHTEYSTYKNRLFPDFDLAYLDRLLAVFIQKRADILSLARASGYDEAFLRFLDERLELLSRTT